MSSKLLLVLRTLAYLKPEQLWFQVWRRVQRRLDPRPVCAIGELPAFTFLNRTARPRGWNDASLELLWRYNLHYFDGLNVPAETDGDRRGLVLRWIRENPRGSFPGWDPYPTSLRIVNWAKWLARDGRAGAGVRDIEESLREQLEWLSSHLEYHILANHYLANLKAMVVGNAVLGCGYAKWLKRFEKQISEQVLPDGAHYERSAMYHAIVLEDVLDVIRFCGRRADALRPVAERMLGHLVRMTGPDGKIAKFNDAADGIAKTPAEIRVLAAGLGLFPAVAAEQGISSSGYLRLEVGTSLLLAKCGEIGPSYQPGHAHADTYSFEFWSGKRKVVGDTGCSTYVPGPVRSYERSTAAHNTVVVDGRDSSEVWASHRVGRRFDFRRHRRTFELDGRELRGVDELNGRGEHEVEVRFHLPPGVPAETVTIRCPGERIVEPCAFADGWNRRAPGLCVLFRQRVRFPVRIAWSVSAEPVPDPSRASTPIPST